MRSSLDTVCASTEVDRVQIHEKDFVLRVHVFKLSGDIGFANFPLDRNLVHLICKNGVAHELLRDGRSAFKATTCEVVDECAHNAIVINT